MTITSKTDPLVSVAMATYNGETFIQAQLESIIHQSHQNIEIIIVDDASTDRTPEILKAYAVRDSRIKLYFNQKNSGHNKAFEKAISLTNSEFIALSDQNDIWLSHKIEYLINFLVNNPDILLCYHAANIIDSNNEVTSNSLWEAMKIKLYEGSIFDQSRISKTIVEMPRLHGCMLMFRHRLKNFILPFPDEIFAHDWWIGFIASVHGKINAIPHILMSYRQHEKNLCGLELTEKRIKEIPLSERYKRLALQYHAMYTYCLNFNENFSYKNQIRKLAKVIHRYYITYLKRYEMLNSSRRKKRLLILLRFPFGLFNLKKIFRNVQIALKLNESYY